MNKSSNVVWQDHAVNQSVREALKGQTAMCIWFTGLSGAGKFTLANLLEQRLAALGKHTYLLDGDNIRHGLNCDLGFSGADRSENIRRAAEVARLMVDAGLIVIASFISPFDFERELARSLFTEDRFKEAYVKASLAVCEARDTKGLYAKARLGQLPNFTGIDSPYDEPSDAEIVIETDRLTIEEAVSTMLHALGIY